MENEYLSKRQYEVLFYIVDFIRENKYAPTVKEIGRNLNNNSKQSADYTVKILVRKGYLSRSNKWRSIEVLKEYDYFEKFEMFIRIDLKIINTIRAYCKSKDLSVNEYINNCLEKSINDIDNKHDKEFQDLNYSNK